MHLPHLNGSRRRGLAMPLLLMVLAILASLMGAILSSNSSALLQVREDGDELSAQFAAEAGAWRAVSRLSEEGVEESPTVLWSEEPMEQVKAAYTVVVTRGPANLDGIRVPDSNHFLVRSEGATTHEEHPTNHVVTMLVKTGSSGSFDTAVFAQDRIILNDGYTDVFDSDRSFGIENGDGGTESNGSNDGRSSGGPGSPSSGKAHIGTNSSSENSVAILGSSTVDDGQGDVLVGPDGDESVVDGTADTYGSVSALSQNRTLESVELPYTISGSDLSITSTASLAPGVFGDVVVDGGELSLSPDATYQFRSLTIVSNGTLKLLDSVSSDIPNTRVFVENSLNIANGSVRNRRGKAENLQFHVADDADVHLTQTGPKGIYVVYAPQSRILIDQASRIKGAVIGQSVEIIGDSPSKRSGVRYDLSLMGVDILGGLSGGGSTGAQVIHVQSL